MTNKSGGSNVATVFGSTGFLGRYVANRLARVGAQVVVPFRGEEKETRHLKPMGEVGQIVPLKFALRDQQSIEAAVSRSNVVVNVLGRHYATRNFTLEDANVTGSYNLAKAAKKAGAERFIHVSHVGASENSESELLRIKAKGEKAVRDAFPNATILRLTQVFGYQDNFLNKFGYLSSLSPLFPLPIRASALVQPIYARDFAAAVMSALEDPKTQGKTYELGGPTIYSIQELIENVVFENTKIPNAAIFELPAPLAKALTWYTEKTRKCIWTQDEINYYKTDNIVPPNALTLDDLNVAATDMNTMAVTLLRQYRKGVQYDVE
jgi:NADH dehydrogenase (ubiquinone) 1 alpha subcomplex subunit 9